MEGVEINYIFHTLSDESYTLCVGKMTDPGLSVPLTDSEPYETDEKDVFR